MQCHMVSMFGTNRLSEVVTDDLCGFIITQAVNYAPNRAGTGDPEDAI